MLDYARQHAIEALRTLRSAVLATSGPAGMQVGEYACEAVDLTLYLLVPRTSDHLFNLEHSPVVTLLAAGCTVNGDARVLPPGAAERDLDLLRAPGAGWCALVQVHPHRVQIQREAGWGPSETIDLMPR